MRKIGFLALLVVFFLSCKQSSRFELLSADVTGISFNNEIIEDENLNILKNEYMYNGGGVGVGDLNNDGLQDLVFTGNKVVTEIYLNKGGLQFERITDRFKGLTNDLWFAGIAIADVDGDGWRDLYLSATLNDDSLKRKNKLWINEGVDEQGNISFTERSDQYGVADTGYSMNSTFFDYDLDGDLDLYVLNNIASEHIPTNYREKIIDGTAINSDKFYRNNGDKTFTDVSEEAGITIEGFGLGLAVGDINKDGWPDLYVSNDYISNDLLYINQQNGTFVNESPKYISYQSKFSMGNDMVDFNDDGNLDVFTLDMLPEDYFRKKQTINGNSYIVYVNDEKYGYQHQYVRNMLHEHNGFIDDEMVPFSEVGQISNIFQTEWSWSPLFADFDNDGDKDLFITNGFPKDLTDKDFTNYKAAMHGYLATDKQIIDRIPIVKVSNYAYENRGEYDFEDVTKEWGMEVPSFSNGAAFVDLDNDGDLDYVVNNINDPAFIYKNNTSDIGNSNYIRIKLEGIKPNVDALGAKVELWYNGSYQYQEHYLTRGYISTVDPVVHFGIGSSTNIDSLRIVWPGGTAATVIKSPEINTLLVLEESEALNFKPELEIPNRLFQRTDSVISYTHKENDFIDFFQYQHIIPHKFSQIGPCMAAGDLDGDGLEDILVGGTSQIASVVMVQSGNGFVESPISGLSGTKECQEADLAIFDIDNDGDNDVIALAGGYISEQTSEYQHFIYRNENGNFIKEDMELPAFSASIVRPFDYDNDGDQDLFVGSRVKKFEYPYAENSFILVNENGKLVPEKTGGYDIGMVTDAVWSDWDNDGWVDLVVTREWNSITVLKSNEGNGFKNTNSGFSEFSGLWSSVEKGDFDGDGDDDYIVGNLGDNHRFNVSKKTPLSLYAIDIDNNGTLDPITTSYWEDKNNVLQEYPVNFFDELVAQSPFFRKKFQSYTDFSLAPFSEMVSQSEVRPDQKYKVNTTSSYIIWNDGSVKRWEKLHRDLQVGPIKEMLVRDFNEDGHLDVIVGGNDYTYDVSTGKYDASKGHFMMGSADGFKYLSPSESGMLLKGQLSTLLYVDRENFGPVLIAGINREDISVFEIN